MPLQFTWRQPRPDQVSPYSSAHTGRSCVVLRGPCAMTSTFLRTRIRCLSAPGLSRGWYQAQCLVRAPIRTLKKTIGLPLYRLRWQCLCPRIAAQDHKPLLPYGSLAILNESRISVLSSWRSETPGYWTAGALVILMCRVLYQNRKLLGAQATLRAVWGVTGITFSYAVLCGTTTAALQKQFKKPGREQ